MSDYNNVCVQMNNDVESLVRDMLRPHWARGAAAAVVTQSPPGDLPPKYEDLGQSSQPAYQDCNIHPPPDLPPQYDEDTMAVPPPPPPPARDQDTADSCEGAGRARSPGPAAADTRHCDH